MKLLKYVKEFKFSATLGFLFKIFEAALELCVPVVMASVIDKGIAYKDTNYILKCGLVLIGLAVFGYLFALVCQWYASLIFAIINAWQHFGNRKSASHNK